MGPKFSSSRLGLRARPAAAGVPVTVTVSPTRPGQICRFQVSSSLLVGPSRTSHRYYIGYRRSNLRPLKPGPGLRLRIRAGRSCRTRTPGRVGVLGPTFYRRLPGQWLFKRFRADSDHVLNANNTKKELPNPWKSLWNALIVLRRPIAFKRTPSSAAHSLTHSNMVTCKRPVSSTFIGMNSVLNRLKRSK